MAAILVPLRGADPQLADGLKRLMRQQYPKFEIQVVVDNAEDPALAMAQEAARELQCDFVRISVLRQKLDTCSPQCSALVQALGNLHEAVEFVTIIDGDVLTHPTWLRELVTPLLDPKVGVAFGNRWFMPTDSQWGSLVRYLWNAGAVVMMYLYSNPWAGTFAIRRKVLFESGLADTWPRSIVPDAQSKSIVPKMGLSMSFVPSLVMVNRERCTLAFAHDFLKRQMMWTRIYDVNWWPILGHALGTTALLATTVIAMIYGLVVHDYHTALWAGGSLIGYLAAMGVMLAGLELGVRRMLRERPERTTWFPLWAWLKLPLAIPLTQIIYTSAAILATVRRRVTWRGVTYDIRSPFDVRIVGDKPLLETPSANTSV